MKKPWMKGIALCLLAVMITLAAAGCGSEQGENNDEKSARNGYPVTVTDQAGREVTIEEQPQRIASSYYISTALLLVLERKDQIVAVEMKADTRKLYQMAAPELLSLPAIGSGKGINVEETAAAKPDLVILPLKLQDAAASFEALDIPVLVVNPETEEEFEECITLLGKATGTDMRASQLLQYYSDRAGEMERLTKGLDRPAVYIASGADYLRTCTGEMYQDDVIQMAGGRNVSTELTDAYWAAISAEQLLEWNPDYIFAVSYAEYSLDAIRANPALAGVNAVKNGRVITFPSDIEAWDYPAPSSVLGIMWMTSQLHPEVYAEEQFLQEADAFYQTFFGISVTAEDMGISL